MFNKLRGMFPVKVILTLSLLQYRVLYILEEANKDRKWSSERNILEEIYRRCDYSNIGTRKSLRLTIRSLIRRGLVIGDEYHHLSYRYPRNHYFQFIKLNTKLDPCVMKFFHKQWRRADVFESHRASMWIKRNSWTDGWNNYDVNGWDKKYNYSKKGNSWDKYATIDWNKYEYSKSWKSYYDTKSYTSNKYEEKEQHWTTHGWNSCSTN